MNRIISISCVINDDVYASACKFDNGINYGIGYDLGYKDDYDLSFGVDYASSSAFDYFPMHCLSN